MCFKDMTGLCRPARRTVMGLPNSLVITIQSFLPVLDRLRL
jgi:hypothetical protein